MGVNANILTHFAQKHSSHVQNQKFHGGAKLLFYLANETWSETDKGM
jgi:hypothetical protein